MLCVATGIGNHFRDGQTYVFSAHGVPQEMFDDKALLHDFLCDTRIPKVQRWAWRDTRWNAFCGKALRLAQSKVERYCSNRLKITKAYP